MTRTLRGFIVILAGTGINLALGVLYSWSIFKGEIRQSIEAGGSFRWDPASVNDPYALACLVFALAMMLAGRSVDRFGPRLTALAGGVLVGIGFAMLSRTSAYEAWVLGFGVLVGAGIAFGYASATPAALKWYPAQMTGRITGIVVAGFGLASVYIAPLSTWLLKAQGIHGAMLSLGIAFFLVVSALALLLATPPESHQPAGHVERRSGERKQASPSPPVAFRDEEATPATLIRQRQFWLLWVLYFIGAGAGLMVIGSMAGLARQSLGANAFLAVAILAIGNAAGRVVIGALSDRIGRKRSLALVFVLQALLMFAAIPVAGANGGGAALIVLVATLIGFNYGANLTLFPAFTKDLWGMKHFGANYGVLFTSWGIGGFVLTKVAESLAARTGSFDGAFATAGALLVAGAALTALIDDHKERARREHAAITGARARAAA
jgi:MFS family permease